MIRNSINIDGITSEFEITNYNLENFHTFQCCGSFDFKDHNIDEILHISLDSMLLDSKSINLNDKTTIILNGETSIKLLASDIEDNSKAFNLNHLSMFSSCLTIPHVDIDYVEVFIIDAFFKLLDSNTCYYSITYLSQINTNENYNFDLDDFDTCSNSLNTKTNYKFIDMGREFF